ncbi:CBS domain-containing protein [Halobellus ordinarius]|uniref:CBS domain-containing protein n=1 Tax=Halobellus ordinarius TaxID=3075120 RepID=UPI00288011F1|nr:CBS domain-containing protein [Halobellus sp. ZY16]
MRVSDICSSSVVTVDVGDSLATAVERMLDEDVGSAVVADGGEPAGIVTKSDVLRAAYRTDEPLSSIPVRAAASAPLVTVGPSTTARRAAEMLDDHDIHRLVVVDGLDVVGIVSTTDLVRNYGGIRSDARKRADAEYDWLTREDVQ